MEFCKSDGNQFNDADATVDDDYELAGETSRYLAYEEQCDFDAAARQSDKRTDKSDRATHDGALDHRSELIIFKMIAQNLFKSMEECLSTGKEANVYRVITGQHPAALELAGGRRCSALKVYMTAIMPFKRRSKYVDGDFRFQHSNDAHGTSWQRVKQWAEKEFRNLQRIHRAGIPCPRPLRLKGVVLLMSFIGGGSSETEMNADGREDVEANAEEVAEDEEELGDRAPKLKEAQLDTLEEWVSAYEQVCVFLRVMFQQCRLIHGDFSEYNLLWWRGTVYVIDVSQAVEHDHVNALQFLRRDCFNINKFFRNSNAEVATLSLRNLFEFIVDPRRFDSAGETETQENFADVYVRCVTELRRRLLAQQDRSDLEHEENTFMQMTIPRHLKDVTHFLRDFRQTADSVRQSRRPDLLYATLNGMQPNMRGVLTDQPANSQSEQPETLLKQDGERERVRGEHNTTSASIDLQMEEVESNKNEREEEGEEEAQQQQQKESEETLKQGEEDANAAKPNLFFRPKHEEKQDKKDRKKEVKDLQRNRRIEKKALKERNKK